MSKPIFEVSGNTFCVSIQPDINMDAFQEAMSEISDAYMREEMRVANEFNVSEETAQAIGECILKSLDDTSNAHTTIEDVGDLISDAAEAEEIFGSDELERHANSRVIDPHNEEWD